MERQLVVSRIKTPDGTILTSTHRHDYREHLDIVSGEVYVLDGGTDYIRRSINKTPATDMFVYMDDPFEEIREAFTWGTYGKDGDKPMLRVPLSKLTGPHIENILLTQAQIPRWVQELFCNELEYRHIIELFVKEGEYES